MRRAPGVVLLVLLGASGLVPHQSSTPASDQRLRSGVDLVLVDAVVLDSRGSPIHGLRQEDFAITENGRPVAIASFSEVSADAGDAESGRLVVLLLDDLGVSPALTVRVKTIARGFVDLMGPDDELAVLNLNGSRNRSTRDKAALLDVIDGYRSAEALTLPSTRPAEHAMETIRDLAGQLAAVEHSRKTLVCIGASWLFDPVEPVGVAAGSLRPRWFEAIRAAARANVSVYVIDPRGLTGQDLDSGVSGFARETGGQAFVNTNAFDRAVTRIWREAGNYYLLGYPAAQVAGGERTRRIQVRVRRDDVTVRARRAIG